MTIRNDMFRVNAIALAVATALASMAARADEEEAAVLKKPTSTIELGVINTSGASDKFGEYNGLNKKGGNLLGNVTIRGGEAYDKLEEGGVSRWSLTGSDLGTNNHSLGANYSKQGEWNVGLSFDELTHQLSDSYRTPYNGYPGGNNFTLPSNFGLAPNTQALNAAQLADFHNLNIASTRRNTALTAGVKIDSRWSVNFDYNHLSQQGAKLQGFGSAGIGAVSGEVVSVLPMPTQSQTDTINLAVNWMGDGAHFTSSYYGSFYSNAYDRVSFQTFQGASAMQNMTTPPSNVFNQLNLAGGYSLSKATKLTGNLSYGRNTQNVGFVVDTGMMLSPLPRASANALVVTSHADLKLAHQYSRELQLSAGVKYDERDNQTPSSIYNFNAISGSASNAAAYPNTPNSYKKGQLLLSGDYRMKSDQHLHLAYAHDNVSRWCNQYAVSTIYPAGTSCMVGTGNHEDRLDASYRIRASESLETKLVLGYADRKANFNPNAQAAFIGTSGGAPGTVGLPGQNAGDFRGFYPFFEASRKQQFMKANVNWQITDQLALDGSGRYSHDNYYDSSLGVSKGSSASVNLDLTYSYSDAGSFNGYVTKQHRQRDLTDQQRTTASAAAASATAIAVPAGATWSNGLVDNDFTFGMGFKQGGLLGGKLELLGDLTRSIGKAVYNTALNYNTTTTGGLSCSNAAILSCGQLPDIRSSLTQLKLSGLYKVDKQSSIVVRLIHQKLSSSDYYYNGYQYGSNPNTLLANGQTAPNYSINVLTVSYQYSF